jgi:hypothetical protein
VDRNELPFEPHHLGVPSDASKIISKPMVHLAETMHLSCTETNTISKQNKTRFCMTHVTLDFCWIHPKQHPSQLYQDLHYLKSDRNELPLEPRHLWVPSGACKMISEVMVRLAQIKDLPCTSTNTISNGAKWDSTRPTSPSSSIGRVQNDFWANGTFDADRAPILNQD